jgi:hypothetical protein
MFAGLNNYNTKYNHATLFGINVWFTSEDIKAQASYHTWDWPASRNQSTVMEKTTWRLGKGISSHFKVVQKLRTVDQTKQQ